MTHLLLIEATQADLITYRDSEASAPAEFPPEQPEADLVADEDEYGAEEREEEEVEDAEGSKAATDGKTNGDKKATNGEDAEMGGVEENGQNGDKKATRDVDEDELSDDGSVDIEGESEDELEEEELAEGEAMDEDAMDVDNNDKAAAAGGPSQAKPAEVKSH